MSLIKRITSSDLAESFDTEPLIIAPPKNKNIIVSQEIKELMEILVKNKHLFETKNKLILLTNTHLYTYLSSLASSRSILLKSNIESYDSELFALQFTKLKYKNRIYYVGK